MGFVMSDSDLDLLRRRVARGESLGLHQLTVDFTTTPEFVRSVLPPSVEPLDEPVGHAIVGSYGTLDFDGNPIGGTEDGFGEIVIGGKVADPDGGYREGTYALAVYKEHDLASIFTRDWVYETCKIATCQLHSGGRRMFGFVDRRGDRIIKVAGEFDDGTWEEPRDATWDLIVLRNRINHDFELEGTPTVGVHTLQARYSDYRVGRGELSFASGPNDPLGEVPIVTVGDATYSAGFVGGKSDWIKPTPEIDPDVQLRHIAARYFDTSGIRPNPQLG